MNTVGIFYHPNREDSSHLAGRLRALLCQHGVPIWCGSAEDEGGLRQVAPQLGLVITLGGDGTIVRAVRAIACCEVPVLGVNMGRLGFLAEVEPERVEQALLAVLDGRYQVEERMMLHTELWREQQMLQQAEVINDVVVGRGRALRTVHVSVQVDKHYVMTQVADGIILSTPTGSTAYCLSAGGPIVTPDMRCIVITPVAAHLAMAHAIIVPAHRHVRLCLVKGVDAVLSIDGQVDVEIRPGDEIVSTISNYTARFVRFGGDGYFYETVLRRLRWPDRLPTL